MKMENLNTSSGLSLVLMYAVFEKVGEFEYYGSQVNWAPVNLEFHRKIMATNRYYFFHQIHKRRRIEDHKATVTKQTSKGSSLIGHSSVGAESSFLGIRIAPPFRPSQLPL